MSRPKTPMRPHKEQDGYVYLRMFRICCGGRRNARYTTTSDETAVQPPARAYLDKWRDQRIISSERVERAVEIDDYLRLCRERGLAADFNSAGVCVADENNSDDCEWGGTIRDAYWRWMKTYGEENSHE